MDGGDCRRSLDGSGYSEIVGFVGWKNGNSPQRSSADRLAKLSYGIHGSGEDTHSSFAHGEPLNATSDGFILVFYKKEKKEIAKEDNCNLESSKCD